MNLSPTVLQILVLVMILGPFVGNLLEAIFRRVGWMKAADIVAYITPLALRGAAAAAQGRTLTQLAAEVGSDPAAVVESVKAAPPPPSMSPPAGSNGAVPPSLLMMLAFVLCGCAGAQEQLRGGLEAARDVVTVAEPCMAAEHDRELTSCNGDATCESTVRAHWAPIADALDVFHTAWCTLSQSSDGCS